MEIKMLKFSLSFTDKTEEQRFLEFIASRSPDLKDAVLEYLTRPPKQKGGPRKVNPNSEHSKMVRNLEEFLADKPVGHPVSRRIMEIELAKKNLEFFAQAMSTALSEAATAGRIKKLDRCNYTKL
jgi:hypothetical protein